jgi:hypothetical protein
MSALCNGFGSSAKHWTILARSASAKVAAEAPTAPDCAPLPPLARAVPGDFCDKSSPASPIFDPKWEALRDRSKSQVATLYADLSPRAAATRLGQEKERAAETTRILQNPVRLRADANLADTDLFRRAIAP